MATIMEKDVLLEYAHIGHLVYKLPQTDEIEQDLKAMGRLWGEIMDLNEEDIDYESTIEKIRTIRRKYE